MKQRFCGATLAMWVSDRLDYYEATYGFTRKNGWSQVEGKGEEINRAYGEYDCCLSLIDAFSLRELL